RWAWLIPLRCWRFHLAARRMPRSCRGAEDTNAVYILGSSGNSEGTHGNHRACECLDGRKIDRECPRILANLGRCSDGNHAVKNTRTRSLGHSSTCTMSWVTACWNPSMSEPSVTSS